MKCELSCQCYNIVKIYRLFQRKVATGDRQEVRVDDIVYPEQRQRKVGIVTKETTYECYEKIANLEKQLDERFYHTLKKLVVNLEQISSMKDQNVVFQNGMVLMLGRESYIRTKQVYTAYLRKLI